MNRKPTPQELLKQMFSDENLKAFGSFFGEDFHPTKKRAEHEEATRSEATRQSARSAVSNSDKR